MSTPSRGGDVAVVGAGIVGLHAALALAGAGHGVVVVAAQDAQETVSAVAGGLWSPFHAGPPEAVQRWARAGYDEYVRLAAEVPEAGVRVVRATVVVEDDAVPLWWEACAPPGLGRPATAAERPPGALAGRVMPVPLVDTGAHLAWLQGRLAAAGVEVVRRRLAAIEEAFEHAPAVVACTGFAARELLGDPELVALRGVVVEVAHPGAAELGALLDDTGSEPTYVLGRADGTALLGGSVGAGDERTGVGEDEVADVLERCAVLVPALRGAPVLRVKAGLRPGRPDVRVARVAHPAGPLVVSHGHGGSGWTLAHGCARDVVALVEQA